MPVPNDLTAEDEAAFAQHGVESSGQGGEPVRDDNEPLAQQGEQDGGEPPQTQHSDRRPNGQFASAEERAAAQQGQQQQGEQQPDGQQTDGQGGEQQGQQQSRMVPHEALHAERLKAQTFAQQNQMLQARMNAILAARQQAQSQDDDQMPDLASDPVGYIQRLENRLAQFEQTRQQENQYREVDTGLQQDESIFSQSVPDYEDASDHYVQSRARELLAFYPPAQAQQMLQAEARQIAQQAWARGQSAAAMVYQLAQARGYTPGDTSAQPFRQQGQLPQGQQQQGRPTPQAQIDAINKGQQTRSLSGGGGAGGTQNLNAQAILAMSDEEFEKTLGLGKKGANERFASLG